MLASRSTWFLVAAIVMCVAGCSRGPAGGPKVVPASGNVTHNNRPVEGATVSFLGDGKTVPAFAITDSAGNFVLSTNRSGDGAVPGKHRVTVSKVIGPPVAKSTAPMSMEEAAKAAKEPPPAKPLSMLPDKYSSTTTSNLNFEVKEGQSNVFKIELTD